MWDVVDECCSGSIETWLNAMLYTMCGRKRQNGKVEIESGG